MFMVFGILNVENGFKFLRIIIVLILKKLN